MESLIVMLALAVLAVPVLLVVALVAIAGLKQRVSTLELQVAQLRQPTVTGAADGKLRPADAVAPVVTPVARPVVPPEDQAGPSPMPHKAPPVVAPAASAAAPASGAHEVAPPPRPVPLPLEKAPSARSRPDFAALAIRAVKRWFTVGNVPVKIGMLVLLAGVAALLKFH